MKGPAAACMCGRRHFLSIHLCAGLIGGPSQNYFSVYLRSAGTTRRRLCDGRLKEILDF